MVVTGTSRLRRAFLLTIVFFAVLNAALYTICYHNKHQVPVLTLPKLNLVYVAAANVNKTAGQQRYMLALHYPEQLTMSSMHLQSFLQLVYATNATGVEPLVRGSRMFTVRGVGHQPAGSSWLRYGALFDLSAIVKSLRQCFGSSKQKLPKRIIMNENGEFFCDSYRRIIIVHIVYLESKGLELPGHLNRKEWQVIDTDVMESHPTLASFQPIVDCTAVLRKHGVDKISQNLLNEELDAHSECNTGHFKVVQSLCLRNNTSNAALTPSVLAKMLVEHQVATNTSIVFLRWQGRRTLDFQFENCSVWPLPHSLVVKKVASSYLSSLHLHEGFISVHVRMEKLLQVGQVRYAEVCMQRLKHLIVVLQRLHKIPTTTLLMKDYGEFGTDTCYYAGKDSRHTVCDEAAQKALAIVVKNNNNSVIVGNVDPAMFHAPQSAGFVSRVEAESLLSGQVLITVGSGSFQDAIIQSFLLWHQNSTSEVPLHYHICSAKEQLHGLEIDVDA